MSLGALTIPVSRASRLTAREVLPGGSALPPRPPAGINLSPMLRASAPGKSARVVCAEAAGGGYHPSGSRLPTIHPLSRARTSPTPVRASSPGHPRHRAGRCVSIGVPLASNLEGQLDKPACASKGDFISKRANARRVLSGHPKKAAACVWELPRKLSVACRQARLFDQFTHQKVVSFVGDLHVPAALLSAAVSSSVPAS